MLRDWNLTEVTDGKRYREQDIVKLGVNECAGCSECCKTVGDSIILDPYDIWQLTTQIHTSFEQLLNQNQLEIRMVDGVFLPNLALKEGVGCSFLDADGRCKIHAARPGICRLFPLGRLYENGDYHYILQVHECPRPHKTKIKISKWLDIPDSSLYHQFVVDWHYFLKAAGAKLTSQPEKEWKQMGMYILTIFFSTPYSADTTFYLQFQRRLQVARRTLGL